MRRIKLFNEGWRDLLPDMGIPFHNFKMPWSKKKKTTHESADDEVIAPILSALDNGYYSDIEQFQNETLTIGEANYQMSGLKTYINEDLVQVAYNPADDYGDSYVFINGLFK